jgi:hypothetical protein
MNSIPREAHEAEMALRFLARANPPPVLFRYRSPNQWTLDEISKQQLYDTSVKPFSITLEVKYKNLDNPFDVMAAIKNDPTEIATNITFRKAEEWGFEKEYRIASNLGDIRQIPFHPSAIKEIRLGARINTNPGFKEKLLEEISHLPHRPKLIQMGCDFDRFILTETVI